MTSYPISANERERLQELFSYQILDTPTEQEFDDLVRIATKMFNVPVAAITFVDATRQWIKAQQGLSFCEMDREVSVCNYTILENNILEIEDLQQDERFKHLPCVVEPPYYRFYAGIPLTTSSGFNIGVFCLIDTVARKLDTEEKQTLTALARQTMRQVELRLRNKQLENLNEKQRQISSRLSHDIKNPLSNIKMMLDMQGNCDTPLPEEDLNRLHEMLAKQVNNTIDILNNMVKWGKLQLSGERHTAQHTNLRQLANEAIAEIEVQSQAKQNIIINAIPASVNASIDAEGMRFALRNLLTNANKFTVKGCITISHEHKNGKDYIHVADTGVGMSKEQLAKLNNNLSVDFSNGTNNEKGNGLGLVLVYDYLAQHDGQLLFQSEVGQGTKASFTLS